ncbi:hypothetical protein SAMN05443633_10231 [Chryseobacterium arachidis]|uniref:Ferredoxin subunit of nitrite reductase or a ring-hydroxylating dioxygenase n=1 Tax=Chryseobacterium arachidis TaxID=1416778 RepID=A0A1M4WFJ4_9FLAO|nr:hypothetical protein [Chryseobacterium arachidis]SHE79722.1 hypothetical protein SAMN05443633_10231 [Chryseobacterium arachidis]
MKKTFSILSIITLLVFSNLSLNSCNTQDTVSCFPNAPVNVTINLNQPAYFDLNQPGGWIYLNLAGQTGTRGLIIVRRSDTQFQAYDRNAPHICPDINTTLEVTNNNQTIICPKDNATWILLTGDPTAVAGIPPKTYLYNYNPSTKDLNIYY